jgi:hypothetical protein
MTGVITNLRHCWLGIENLNKLVLIMKIWLYDLRFECTNGPKSFEKILNCEDGMVSKTKDLIVNFNLFEKE